MMMRYAALCAGLLVAIFGLQSKPANALSTKECSAKYKAAKEAGTLNGMKWNDFRKAQCGAEATATPEPAPAPATTPSPKTANPASPPASAPVATGNAVFPSAISSKYSASLQVRREERPASISTGLLFPAALSVRKKSYNLVG